MGAADSDLRLPHRTAHDRIGLLVFWRTRLIERDLRRKDTEKTRKMMKLLPLLCAFANAEVEGIVNIHVGSPSVITSPEFPENMPTQAQVSWTITADPGYNVKIEFIDFFLPVSPQCKLLFLSISTDSADSNMISNRFCGMHPKVFIVAGSYASLFLRADSDPDPTLFKKFKLKVSKTRERPSNFAPNTFAGKMENPRQNKKSPKVVASGRPMMPMGPAQPQLPLVHQRASAGAFGGSSNVPAQQFGPTNFQNYGPPGIQQRPMPVQPTRQQIAPVSIQNGVAPPMPEGQQNKIRKEENKSLSLIIPFAVLMVALFIGASAFLIKNYLRDD